MFYVYQRYGSPQEKQKVHFFFDNHLLSHNFLFLKGVVVEEIVGGDAGSACFLAIFFLFVCFAEEENQDCLTEFIDEISAGVSVNGVEDPALQQA